MDIDTKTARRIIAENEYTILVVSSNGEIKNLIPLTSMPSAELITQIGGNNKGNAFQILQKSNLTEHQLSKEVNSLVEALKWSRTHKLKPGVNIPDKKQ